MKTCCKDNAILEQTEYKGSAIYVVEIKQSKSNEKQEMNSKMKYSNEELLKLWANDKKRREFVDKYKEWGVYSSAPEMNLTFYRYELSDGVKIVVMEYLQKTHSSKPESIGWRTETKVYLQKDACFMPHAVSEYVISDHLKILKKGLLDAAKKENADESEGQLAE